MPIKHMQNINEPLVKSDEIKSIVLTEVLPLLLP
jgi:hypothetical protein